MFFKKKKKPAAPVVGITESDWIKIHNAIQCEFIEAESRQKSPDAKPSAYMKGLSFALDALDSIKPYTISEVH